MKKLLAAMLLSLAGCQPDAADVPSGKSVEITRAELGEDWPFAVEKVTVHCTGHGMYRLVTDSDGHTYGLNGTSKSARKSDGSPKWEDIEKIWVPGKDIGQVLEIAAKNCK
ncbi:DUF2511 domain-containing protein [Hymenobacter sp. H14-R3]|uniref:DUF2511 domain-containing protein n=1 Tax=Hymenobacter sp. H14-R3 TaxID=3046308 RepID=UPI0024BB554E|nr:DUF2511 domain-containing protein [Hymenobacter sp. H14-R3]MDJ0363587.1 DUF2511 domain-containing protein [Hymenobacter sp. H14-R3]